MNIVIDATNIGGGGGVTHLKELLAAADPPAPVIVIAQQKILDQLPDHPSVKKISHALLGKSLLHRVFFQLFLIDRYIPRDSILFAPTGDYLGRHKPVVSMSQNMLLYERQTWKEMNNFREVSRFRINFLKQKRSFKNSEGVIFISGYAKNYVSGILDLKGKSVAVIHHGIAPRFIKEVKPQKSISEYSFSNPFKFVYVSTVHVYKNQWNVVEAIASLRKLGYPVELDLVGGVIFEAAGRRLDLAIRKFDPGNEFIHRHGDVPYDRVADFYQIADGIIFASSCENMPNILIESMASGTPVACSDKAPMPDFLKEHGFYFDAHRVDSIVAALAALLDSPQQRKLNASNALKEALKYSWQSCSRKTFDFLTRNYENSQR